MLSEVTWISQQGSSWAMAHWSLNSLIGPSSPYCLCKPNGILHGWSGSMLTRHVGPYFEPYLKEVGLMGLVAVHGNQKVRTKMSVNFLKLKLKESFGGLIPPPLPSPNTKLWPLRLMRFPRVCSLIKFGFTLGTMAFEPWLMGLTMVSCKKWGTMKFYRPLSNHSSANQPLAWRAFCNKERVYTKGI
jgi:hypothetical protein